VGELHPNYITGLGNYADCLQKMGREKESADMRQRAAALQAKRTSQ
jgi:hypothetical protein